MRDCAEASLQEILVRVCAGLLRKLDGACDQLMRSRRTQILGNLLAVAEICERQFRANQSRQCAAEAGRFIELGDTASSRTRGGETFERLFDCTGLRGGGENEARLESLARVGESFELGCEARVALAQAGAVDENQTTLADMIEQLGKLAGSVDRVCRNAEQSAERV